MKTKRNPFSRKALSVLLTIVMVFGYVGLFSGLIGDDLFGTKQEADAALASQLSGNYTWRIRVVSENDTGGWTTEALLVYGKSDNGRAGEKSGAILSKYNWFIDFKGERTNTFEQGDQTTAEFPSRIVYSYDFGGGVLTWRELRFYLYLEVKNTAGNWVNIPLNLSASNVSEELNLGANGGSGGSYEQRIQAKSTPTKQAKGTITYTPNANWPALVSVGITGNTSINTSDNSNAMAVYQVTSAKDQFGVNWGFDEIAWTSSHSAASVSTADGVGTVTFGNNSGDNGTNCGTDYTTTVKPNFIYRANDSSTAPKSVNVSVKTMHGLAFDFNGGSGNDAMLYGRTGETVSMPVPTRTGFTRNGWSVNSGSVNSNNVYTFANYAKATATAQWIGNSYNVAYGGNGSTGGNVPGQTLENGTPAQIRDNNFERKYTIAYNGNGATLSTTSATETWGFTGWTGSASNPGYIIEALNETTGIGKADTDVNFAQWTVTQPFKPGEVYVLEFEAKGTGTLQNFFYGGSSLQVASSVSNKGVTDSRSDGHIAHTLTSDYTQYQIVWTLGSSGNQDVNKHVLFRVTGSRNNATIKNVRFYQTRFFDGSSLQNLAASGTYNMAAQWTEGSVTLPNPTRSGWVFHDWSKTQNARSGEYLRNTTYTFGQDTALYAIWSRDIGVTYHWLNPDDLTDKTGSASGTAWNNEAFNLTAPTVPETEREISEKGKTWTLKGWNERSTVLWGGATATAAAGIGASHPVGTNSSVQTYMPVYALKSTDFYADFNYYLTGAEYYSAVTMKATVNGDAANGDMPKAPVAENGTQTTALNGYAKNGKYYELVGWNLTAPANPDAANPVTGTPDIPVGDGTVSLAVPGATDSNKHNTRNYDEHIQLYPVYRYVGPAIISRFHYYDKEGNDQYYEVSSVVPEGAASCQVKFPASAALIKNPGTATEIDNNTYSMTTTAGLVTYTLAGWNYTQDAADSTKVSVQDSESYLAFGETIQVATQAGAEFDHYDFYPVYTTTTTARYHYYDAHGAQKSDVRTSTQIKYDFHVPMRTDVAVLDEADDFSKTVTLEDGRTFTFVGWRRDTDSKVYAVLPTTEAELHAVRDEEYDYYAIYSNDQLTLSYSTTHKTLTASCTPPEQVLSQYGGIQYINAGLPAHTDNASVHSFTVNPGAGTAEPLREGYTFIGWDTDDNETEEAEYVNEDTIEIRHNQTLYAKYTVDTRNLTYVYYDKAQNGLTGPVVTVNADNAPQGVKCVVSYDDLTRDDTGTNDRYVAVAPTVKKQGSNQVNEATIAHANDTYHYVFSSWQRSDGRGVYTSSQNGNDYVARFKNVQEDITVRAIYDAYRHHFVSLTKDELPEGETQVFKEATCTEDGFSWERCTVCGYTNKRIIAKFDHKNSEGTEIVTYSGYKPATCEAEGSYATAACAICGKVVMDGDAPQYYDYNSDTKTFVRIPRMEANGGVIDALGHNYQVSKTVLPTCTEDGYVLEVCQNDSTHTRKIYDPENEALKALGHDVDVTPAVAATCTTDGATKREVCLRCGYILAESTVVPAKGHKVEKTASYKAPTCTEPGNIEYYTCTVEGCGAMFKDRYATKPVDAEGVVLAALGHHYVDVAAAEATCTLPGHSAGRICDRCGDVPAGGATITSDPLGHDWLPDEHVDIEDVFACQEPAGYTKHVCNRCGEEEIISYDEVVAHTPEQVNEQEATCKVEGHSAYTKCSVCGEVLEGTYVVYDKIPHIEKTADGSQAVEPTCTDPGRTAKIVCERCGDVLQESQTVAPLGHNYSAWVVTKKATCTEAGEKMRFCKRCNAEPEIVEVPAEGHKEIEVEKVDPTCYEEGRQAGVICSVCGAVISGCEVIPKSNQHVMGQPMVFPATCTEEGRTVTKCVNFEYCGYQTTVTTEALGHQMETVKEAIPATCENDGWTAEKKCTRDGCGYVEKAEYAPKLEHVWQVVGATVTCTEAGHSEYEQCVNCHRYLVEPQELPALGHDWTAWEVTPAKCTISGKKVRTCLRDGCDGKEVVAIPATGHRMTVHYGVPARCGVTGRETYYTCAVCHKNFRDEAGRQECDLNDLTITALEHDWQKVDTVEPTCTVRGYDLEACSLCGASRKTNYVATADHKEGIPATCSTRAICSVCNREYGPYDGNNHDYQLSEHVSSTCTVKGHDTYECSWCHRTKTTTLDLADHNTETVWDPAPTCTAGGSYQEVCRDCGKVISEGSVPATGHSDQDGDGVCNECGEPVNASQPGDNEGGSSTGACEKCGRNHTGKDGSFFGYNGFICRLIAFFRMIANLFKK